MPNVVATLTIKEDQIENAKSFLKQLSADTLAKEPGTLEYTVHQRKDDPKVFVFFEKYESDEALATHSKNLREVGGEFAKLLAGPPEIHVLDEV